MKTVRLLYPDYQGGGLNTYYLGAKLMSHILPENTAQELLEVKIAPPDSREIPTEDGIYAKKEVTAHIAEARKLLEAANPDKIITIGGDCLVSAAPFDYLHEKYEDVGIIWLDAHPDVSTAKDGYPCAHAMVLGSLLGGDKAIRDKLKANPFPADALLYVGLQELLDYQVDFLREKQVNYKIQTKDFVSDGEIINFAARFKHILVHLDIDVLDATLFHSTYFANSELVGDGSGSGKMTLEKLSSTLKLIEDNSDIVGLTIAEYLPFEAEKLHNMFASLKLFGAK